ncbi:MBL fold metallo-hydrolase [Murdochiella vaginalis]|uniref:MBL fold metallo-hydrolase n=1 Tax=Murdochiella vaginalis TaxID=1852373 RepID=UPI0008FDF432|nr:MBL fold metallo-hydrolase [Murdochiella vaginalis]
MRLCSLASGSSGNSVLIQSDHATVLIDAGYSAKRIEQLLRAAGVHPKKLDAILVTHEHSDHIAGLGVLTRRYHLPIYANENTWRAMEKKVGRHRDRDHVVFRNKQPFQIQDMTILPVPIHHDCADPVGYAIRCGEEKIAVLTDTGIVDSYMMNAMRGADIYYLEANYEDLLLRHGPYSFWSKKRIASEVGHLSNRQAGEVLCEWLEGRGEQVLLAHMSINNNTEECCLHTVSRLLTENGFAVGSQVHVSVAPRSAPSGFFSAGKAGRLPDKAQIAEPDADRAGAPQLSGLAEGAQG